MPPLTTTEHLVKIALAFITPSAKCSFTTSHCAGTVQHAKITGNPVDATSGKLQPTTWLVLQPAPLPASHSQLKQQTLYKQHTKAPVAMQLLTSQTPLWHQVSCVTRDTPAAGITAAATPARPTPVPAPSY